VREENSQLGRKSQENVQQVLWTDDLTKKFCLTYVADCSSGFSQLKNAPFHNVLSNTLAIRKNYSFSLFFSFFPSFVFLNQKVTTLNKALSHTTSQSLHKRCQWCTTPALGPPKAAPTTNLSTQQIPPATSRIPFPPQQHHLHTMTETKANTFTKNCTKLHQPQIKAPSNKTVPKNTDNEHLNPLLLPNTTPNCLHSTQLSLSQPSTHCHCHTHTHSHMHKLQV
jgi:hypothetical protein